MIATLAVVATMAASPSPVTLEAGLAGDWSGALGYRDYQSNKLYQLPVRKHIQALDDGATVIEISKFDDGPKTGFVYITGVSLFEAKTGFVFSVALRKGKPVETPSRQAVHVATYVDPSHWTLIYEEAGQDDDKPARIRLTETRDGDILKRIEEVAPLAPQDAPWAFRNQVRVTRAVSPS